MESKRIVSFDGAGLKLDSGEDAQVICDAMRSSGDELEILMLQGNSFGIEAAEMVGQQLSQHSNLKEAHFKDLFTTRGREQVPEALNHLLGGIESSGAELTLLDLSDNAIGPIGAPSVVGFLQSESANTIEKLYVNNCGWGPEGSTSLSKVLHRLTRLREFVCGRSRLENKGAINVSAALSKNRGLEVLIMNQNGTTIEGIKAIASILDNNHETIQRLDLSDNTIKPEGCELIGKAIAKFKNLKELSLGDALIENQGFITICQAISKNPSLLDTLQKVNCEGNELKGNKIVDLVETTFPRARCRPGFQVILLANDFNREQRKRLSALHGSIVVDSEDDSDYCDDENEDENPEVGEITDTSSENSDGYVDLGFDEFRERIEEFIRETQNSVYDAHKVRTIFMEMIAKGRSTNIGSNFQAVQVLCEELGLIKCELTRKKKPLAMNSILYIGKSKNDLPKEFKDYFECVVKNNDDLSCGKLLFSSF